MTLRKFILVILALSVAYSIPFWPQILQTGNELLELIADEPMLLACMVVSIAILLVGHGVRAYRDTVLFSKAATTTVGSQFTAFAAGSFCNSILPLRIGEFIRADVIAQKYGISFSFSFVLICVERLCDAVILGVVASILFGPNLSLIFISCFLLIFVLLIWSPPHIVKKALSSSGRFLNEQTEAKLLFTFWSLEYGLRRTLRTRIMAKYLLIAILNWVIYILALCPTIAFLSGWGGMFGKSVGAFTALTASVAPGALGSYSPSLVSLGFEANVEFIILWVIAIVPTALIGFILTLTNLRTLPLLRTREKTEELDFDNKLSRNADISLDQFGFMRDYYSGKSLAKEIAQREMNGGPALARYFTAGGSGAMTYQSKSDDSMRVTKLVSQENSKPLRSQYRWLKEHAGPNVARAMAEHEDDTTYSIDIEYESSSVDLLDWLHKRSFEDGVRAIDVVVDVLAGSVWNLEEAIKASPDDARARVNGYIERNILESLEQATASLSVLENVMNSDELIVNGRGFPSFDTLLQRVRSELIMKDLCSFRLSDSIHGDLIIDNIVYSQAKDAPVILDPVVQKNFFEGPVFDFGKLSQSLQIGYEFLLRDVSPVKASFEDGVCFIDFIDKKSAVYERLWEHVRDELAPRYLTESERRTMLFLGATNCFRRMKYQAVQYPQNALKFYAQGICFLDEYVRLFDCQEGLL